MIDTYIDVAFLILIAMLALAILDLQKRDRELKKRLFGHYRDTNAFFTGSILHGLDTDNRKAFDKLDAMFSCNECFGIFTLASMQKIEESRKTEEFYSPFERKIIPESIVVDKTYYYCIKDKKPYSKIFDYKFYKDNIEVDQKGKEVK